MQRRMPALSKKRTSQHSKSYTDQSQHTDREVLKSLCSWALMNANLKELILSRDHEIRVQGLELAANLYGEEFYQGCVQALANQEVIKGQDVLFCLWFIESVFYSPLDSQTQTQILSSIESLSLQDQINHCDLSLLARLPQLKKLSLKNLPKAECGDSNELSFLTHFSFDMSSEPNQYFPQWFEQVTYMTHLEELDFKHSMRQTSWSLTQHQSLRKLNIEVPTDYDSFNLIIDDCPLLKQVFVNQCNTLEVNACPKLTQLSAKLKSSSASASIDITNCPSLENLHLDNARNPLSCMIQGSPAIKELTLKNGRLTYVNIDQLDQLNSLKLIGSSFDLEDLELLSSVQELYFENSNLFNSPFEVFTQLKSLSIIQSQIHDLDLSSCSSLKSLTLEKVQHLSTLQLNTGLQTLNVRQIEITHLNTEQLQELERVSFKQLPYLEALQITSESLSDLVVDRCPKLLNLDFPTSALRKLVLTKINTQNSKKQAHKTKQQAQNHQEICTSVLKLQSGSPLATLSIADCDLITEISGLDQATFLTDLSIRYSKLEISLEDLTHLKELENIELDLDHSPQNTARDCSSFSQMKELRSLRLKGLSCLDSLQGLESLSKLESLEFVSCHSLEDLGVIESLHALSFIRLNHCPKLKSLQLTQQHSLLNRCHIHGSLLKHLSVQGLGNLRELSLDNSGILDLKLNQLPSIKIFNAPRLQQVRALNITELNPNILGQKFDHWDLSSDQLTSLVICNLASLNSLKLNAPNLRSITLNELNKLRTLQITGPLLENLNLEGLNSLKDFSLLQASNLNQGLDWQQFSQLSSLELSEYSFLHNLEQISPLNVLRKLNIKKIEAVNDLYCIHEFFPELEDLSLSAFVQYKSAIELRKLPKLKLLFPCRLWRAVGLRKSFKPSPKNVKPQAS